MIGGEDDKDFRARIAYVMFESKVQAKPLESVWGEQLDEIAERYNLKRREQ